MILKKIYRILLKSRNLFFSNTKIISNDFNWDDNWNAISFKKPIIHSFNKDEIILDDFPEIYSEVNRRKNVILLWDSLWDPDMVEWFKYRNLLKVWFLNYKEEENLEAYKLKYDIIITWDWGFEYLNNYLWEFLTKKS